IRASTLEGFAIPGTNEKLVSALFADDTTAFLREDDSFGELMTLLDGWCLASRARFNNDKTEVLPVGTKTYREMVVRERCLKEGTPLPVNVRIVPDRQPVRILGAWMGNLVDQGEVWAPIVDKIKLNLERWERRNPTMYGRKLIVGVEVGCRTQFLARAQGMPKSVEQALTRAAGAFMWKGDLKPMVNVATLHRPICEGGLNLLDVAARNEAIDVVMLRDYLRLEEGRPRWGVFADAILAKAILAADRHLPAEARTNMFLQEWGVNTLPTGGLPRELAGMVKTAKKYGVHASAAAMEEKVKLQMPAWMH
ncbi:hypothetical protein C2E23DRAFT_704431, partial [Lenzites betulinus]